VVSTEPEPGTLFVVSTPIGNMGDFSFRAVEILQSVALVLAEDTRHSRHLLDHYSIRTPIAAHHEHNEARSLPGILDRLRAGDSVALISDAGTPLVSDPGARLVRAAIDAGFPVVPVPGASAVLAALVASGFAAQRFTFYGFLPRKGRERRAALESLAALDHPAVLYEAPPRLADTLEELAALGDRERPAMVARELTKRFEELRRGTVGSLAAYYKGSPPRGEIVIVLDRVPEHRADESSLRPRAAALRAEGRDAREIIRALMDEGAPRNLAYRLAHEP
jgi:16S rRNA (cytidine1402-2'-O)-methyltransferase